MKVQLAIPPPSSFSQGGVRSTSRPRDRTSRRHGRACIPRTVRRLPVSPKMACVPRLYVMARHASWRAFQSLVRATGCERPRMIQKMDEWTDVSIPHRKIDKKCMQCINNHLHYISPPPNPCFGWKTGMWYGHETGPYYTSSQSTDELQQIKKKKK